MVNTMSETSAPSEKAEFNRLWWHSRRGMLELDNLLIPFVEQAYRDLNLQVTRARARHTPRPACRRRILGVL